MNKECMKSTFYEDLCKIKEITTEKPYTKLGQILDVLQDKGYAAMFILFSLPFCIPVNIPGFSTPFGAVMGFAGLRMVLGLHPWWPNWIKRRSVKSSNVELVVTKTRELIKKIEHLHKRRWAFLSTNPIISRINGLVVILLSALLALPLPIPFSNFVCGVPLLLMGLGMLEDDGLAILLAYVFTVVCVIFFIGLYIFGSALITRYF